jgi:mono/diheme cytochrome c family protein
VLLVGALGFSLFRFAGGPPDGKAGRKDSTSGSSNTAVVQITDADSMRVQGEQRFHANCGRCHAAPQKFPPRMMATIIRHMRVRATITDADMRLILSYMTQ